MSLPAQIKVMALGDSITQAEKNRASYRYFLSQQMKAAGYCVDFVGTQAGNYKGSAKYSEFDQDHQGIWGIRTDEVAKDIVQWMRADMPDVVMCHIGTNDFWQFQSLATTIVDMNFLIDEMRRANPTVRILLAQIIPVGPTFNIDVRPLNNALPVIVANKQSASSPITLVDHFTGWDNSIHSYDDVHNTELGDQRMANTWFQAFEALGLHKCRVSSNELRVLPFGDSITEAEGGQASYRYFLSKELKKTGHCVNFVGTKWGVHNGQAKYNDFDQGHDGKRNEMANKLAQRTFAVVQETMPDVILCHIGNVDMFNKRPVATVVGNIGSVIDNARAANPSVTILLAAIVPFDPAIYPTVDVTPLNNALPALVSSKTTAQSPVVLVDHFTGWDPALLSWDGVHPNEQGEIRMANTWAAEILKLQRECAADFATFGQGCQGNNGIPEIAAGAGQRPVLGATFDVEFSSMPPNSAMVGMIGFSDMAWSGLLLPLDLGFMGAPGCELLLSLDFMSPLATDASGFVRWTLPVPTNPVLSNIRFYMQGYAADPGVNAAGLITSNAGLVKLGVR